MSWQKIFEPFFTAKCTGRRLGLAAVSDIVRSHKAALKVRSELGRGTEFTLLLPVDGEAVAPSSTPSAPPARFTGTALVVDDEDMIRDVVAAMLQSTGWKTACKHWSAKSNAGTRRMRS